MKKAVAEIDLVPLQLRLNSRYFLLPSGACDIYFSCFYENKLLEVKESALPYYVCHHMHCKITSYAKTTSTTLGPRQPQQQPPSKQLVVVTSPARTDTTVRLRKLSLSSSQSLSFAVGKTFVFRDPKPNGAKERTINPLVNRCPKLSKMRSLTLCTIVSGSHSPGGNVQQLSAASWVDVKINLGHWIEN